MNKIPQKWTIFRATLKPSEKDIGVALLYRMGIVTFEEVRQRGKIELKAQIPSKIIPRLLISRLRKLESQLLGRKIFHSPRLLQVSRLKWDRAYQEFLKPFPLDPKDPKGLWIDPSGKGGRDANTLTIKASLAFGTGTHATTRLASQLLKEVLRKERMAQLLDVGCGTGILAMVALRLGCPRAFAVDNDPEALAMARQNVRHNRIRGIRFTEDIQKVPGRYPLVVANITLNTLRELKRPLLAKLKDGAYLILSGLLYRDIKEILRIYSELKPLKRLNQKGWSALLMEKEK